MDKEALFRLVIAEVLHSRFAIPGALQLFDMIIPLTNGGPSNSSHTIVSFLYAFGIGPVTRVFLGLHVKVAKEWQRDPKQLGRLGF